MRAGDMVRFKAMSPNAKFKFDSLHAFNKQAFKPFFKGDSAFKLKMKTYKFDSKNFVAPKMSPQMLMKWDNMKLRMVKDSISYAKEAARANGVIADLVAAKVVPDAKSVKWFGLSNDELIVNGKKQPDALHEKLKAKYGVHENYGLYYGPVEMTGTGVFIDNEAHVNMQLHNLQQLRLKQQQFFKTDTQFKAMKLKSWSPDKDFSMQQRGDIDQARAMQKRLYRTAIKLNDIIADVTDDLVSENVIKSKNDLESFKLTNSFLMVNGKKQSEDIHEKLKRKFLSEPSYMLNRQSNTDPHFGIHYTKNGSMGIGIDVDRDDP